VADLESLNDHNADINLACESIRENVEASASDSSFLQVKTA